MKMFRVVVLLIVVFGIYFSSGQAMARTALEECKLFKESKLPGTCTVQCEKCDCAYIVDNLELPSCKDCSPGVCNPIQCNKEECSTKCPENSECEQP